MNTRNRMTTPPFQTQGPADIQEPTREFPTPRFFVVVAPPTSTTVATDGGPNTILECVMCMDNGNLPGSMIVNFTGGTSVFVAASSLSAHNVGDVIIAMQLPGGTSRTIDGGTVLGNMPLAWVEIATLNAAVVYATAKGAVGGEYTGYIWNPQAAPGAAYGTPTVTGTTISTSSGQYQTGTTEGPAALSGLQAITIINPCDAEESGENIWSLPTYFPVIGIRGPNQANGTYGTSTTSQVTGTPTYYVQWRSDVVTQMRVQSGILQSYTAAGGWQNLLGPWVTGFSGSVSAGNLTALFSDGSTASLA